VIATLAFHGRAPSLNCDIPRVVLGGVSDEIPSLVRRNQCRVAARVKCVKCCNGHWLEQGDAVTPQRCPADDAGPLSHGSTQPDLRKRHGSQYAGQRRVRTGLGVQSDRQSRFGLCRSATAEFAEYGERVAIRRRLRASALGTHPVRARCGAFARACAAPPAAAAETKRSPLKTATLDLLVASEGLEPPTKGL
jgi:hypothetical protein